MKSLTLLLALIVVTASAIVIAGAVAFAMPYAVSMGLVCMGAGTWTALTLLRIGGDGQ